MTRQPRSFVVTLVLALACQRSAVAARPRPEPVDLGAIEVPPEAARHNADGMKAYEAGDYGAAYAAFKRSHMSMDPRADLHARDMILGSLRGSLGKLYEKTGDLQHLCLVRTELVLHLETLLITFGEDTDLQDIPGIKARLRQINQRISQHRPRLGEPTCDGPPMQLERPAPPPPAKIVASPRPPDRGRPALIVGATSLSIGGVLLGAMTYALFMRRASDESVVPETLVLAQIIHGRVSRSPMSSRPCLGQPPPTSAPVLGVRAALRARIAMTTGRAPSAEAPDVIGQCPPLVAFLTLPEQVGLRIYVDLGQAAAEVFLRDALHLLDR